MKHRALVLGTGLLLLGAAACGNGGSTQAAGSKQPTSITVFAASSLSNAFGAEAKAFTAKTGIKVTFSFAGSQELAAQVEQGAPADVLATADTKTMDAALKGAKIAAAPTTFARNTLVIVTAPGNPKHLSSLASLGNSKLVVVLAGPTVPAGKYAAAALVAEHVVVHPKSLEDNVRGVLTKVELDEADAGIVYATDAQSAADKVVSVPIAASPIATYPVVALKTSGASFVTFVLSADGQAILRAAGFLPPA
jgi:molybdate transport system substrate-binding protein